MVLKATVEKESLIQSLPKSSRTQMFFKKGVLRNFATFTGKYLSWSLFLIKLQGLEPATLFKRDFNSGAILFFAKFLRTAFSVEHLQWLLLSVQQSTCSVKLNVGLFLPQKFVICSEYVICTLLVETIPMHFY